MKIPSRLRDILQQATIKPLSWAIRRLRHPTFRHILVEKVYRKYFSWRKMDVRTTTAFGMNMRLTIPDSIQTRILLTGVWEPEVTHLIDEALALGNIFIDIGANVGYFSLLASMKVGSSGRIYAFEASPRIYDRLQENLRINGISNVNARNIAISNIAGTVSIWTAPEGNLGHSTIVESVAAHDGHTREAKVPCDTILSLVPLPDLLAARFIKIDIEGAERLAIEGILAQLDDFSIDTEWLVELSPEFSPAGKIDTDWIFHSFLKAGYLAYQISNDYKSISAVPKGTHGRPRAISEAPADRINDILFSKRPH